jgi:hypothetical protein
MNERGGQELDRVKVALDFLDHTASPEQQQRLEELESFRDISQFAAELGYDLDRAAFAAAMKIHVNRVLETSGVPSWIRNRVNAPIHD